MTTYFIAAGAVNAVALLRFRGFAALRRATKLCQLAACASKSRAEISRVKNAHFLGVFVK